MNVSKLYKKGRLCSENGITQNRTQNGALSALGHRRGGRVGYDQGLYHTRADLSDSGSNIITVDRTYSTTVNEDALLAAAKISENVRSYTDELLLGVGAASGGVLSDDSVPGVSMAKRCVVEYTYET